MAKKKDMNKLREFSIASKDITEVADFGSFEIIKTKQGVMFKTYRGYHVWCTPYVTDLEGKAQYNSLYAWQMNLMEAKKAYDGEHRDEPLPDLGITKGDMLDAMKIITEVNLMHPVTAFVDADEAASYASKRMEWMGEMQEKLEEAMRATVTEETEEDIKANAEHDLKAIEGEAIAEMLKEGE